MCSLDFLDKPFRMFPGQSAMAHIGENLIGKSIAGVLPLSDVLCQFLFHTAFDAVPDVHVGILEHLKVDRSADQAVILILQAPQCCMRIQKSFRLLF